MQLGVPHVLWTLWFQGWEAAPPLVRSCLESWRRHNPGWEIRALSLEDLEDLPGITPDLLARRPAAASDIARIHLLHKHGGVWVDATTFCMTPLDAWLPQRAGNGFFAFDLPGRGRDLSSWLIAGTPESPLIQAWYDATQRYWEGREMWDHYFWFHRLFGQTVRADPDLWRLWRATRTMPPDGAHYFTPYDERFTGPMSARTRARLMSGREVVYKLTHKRDAAKADEDSALRWFVDGARRPLQTSPAMELADLVADRGRTLVRRRALRAVGVVERELEARRA